MQVYSEESVVHTRAAHFEWEMDAAKSMCLFCGFIPVEGMRQYVLIHGEDAKCIRCHHVLPSVERIDS